MTIHDPQRDRSKPVEEVARAIWDARNERFPETHRLSFDDLDSGSPSRAACHQDARAVLSRLVALGFLTPEYFKAAKAEESPTHPTEGKNT